MNRKILSLLFAGMMILASAAIAGAQTCQQYGQTTVASTTPYLIALKCNFTASSQPFGAFQSAGVLFWNIQWTPVGTVSAASLSVDSSTTGASGTWTTGGTIPSATIGSLATPNTYSNGSATTPTPFAQLTASVTGSGSVVVTIFGYATNPGGGGGSFSAVTAGTNTNPLNIGSGGSLNATGTGVINATNGMLSTVGAAGTTVVDRINTQCGTSNPGSSISAMLDNIGVINDTGALDWVNPACNVWLAGHTIYRTSTGYSQADRQRIRGAGAGNGGTSVTTTTGSGINANSTFPTGQTGGGGITVSGNQTSGATTLTVALAAGPNNVNVGDGDELYLAGDATRYFVKPCTAGTAPPCTTATSRFYTLVQGGAAVTLNIVAYGGGTLASSPTNGTAVGLLHPIDRNGDFSVASGGSVQDTRISDAFISGNSAFGGTGAAIGFMAGISAQENTGFDYLRVRDAVHGVVVWGSHRSSYIGGNASWDNSSFCLTAASGVPATIPVEVGSFSTVFYGFTVFASACTPANLSFGLYHITNNPLSTLGNGPMYFINTHGEMCGGTGGSTGCNGSGIAGDNFQLDASTGDVYILGGSSCSSGFPCQNSVHIKSAFAGTLLVDGLLVNGATNWVQDDGASNTIAAAAVSNGSGYYRINNSGNRDTNLPCTGTGITWANGWCGAGPARQYYVSSVAVEGFDSSENLTAASATLSGTCPVSGSGSGLACWLGSNSPALPSAGTSGKAVAYLGPNGIAQSVGTAKPDYVATKIYPCADTSASATTYTCTTGSALTAYAAGQCFRFYSINQNNSGAATLNVDGIAPKSLVKWQGTALAASDLKLNSSQIACYDGTNIEVATIGNAPSGSATTLTYWGTSGYNGSTAAATANTLTCGGFVAPNPLSVGHITVNVSTADNTNNSSVGVYNSSGTLLGHVVAFTSATTGNRTFAFAEGTISIPAGKNFFCYTSVGATFTLEVLTQSQSFYAVQSTGIATSAGAQPAGPITPPSDNVQLANNGPAVYFTP
jgi:hypothetical protein